MEIFNPLDADKWRGLIADFDRKREDFFATLADLGSRRGATPALEAERQSILKKADPIKASIAKFMETANAVRGWLQQAGKWFGLGSPAQTVGGLGLAPILIGVGIGAAVLIVNQITDWLKIAAQWNAKAKIAAQVASAGGSAKDIEGALAAGAVKEQPKIFGLESGGLKWLVAIAGLVIAGPFIMRKLQKRF